MKKILSLAFMLLVAAFAVDASAQASKLVGKWNADISAMELETGMFSGGDIKITFEFDNDGDCEVNVLLSMNQAIDSATSLIFKMEMEFDYAWVLAADKLSLRNPEVEMEVKEFRFSPSSPEMEAFLPMFKQQVVSEFNKQKGQIANQMVSTAMQVKFVNDNTVVLTPLDDATNTAYTLRRVK